MNCKKVAPFTYLFIYKIGNEDWMLTWSTKLVDVTKFNHNWEQLNSTKIKETGRNSTSIATARSVLAETRGDMLGKFYSIADSPVSGNYVDHYEKLTVKRGMLPGWLQ
jgi:hypothetical protein